MANVAAAWEPAEAPSVGEEQWGSVEVYGLCQLQAGAGEGIPKCKHLADLLALGGMNTRPLGKEVRMCTEKRTGKRARGAEARENRARTGIRR